MRFVKSRPGTESLLSKSGTQTSRMIRMRAREEELSPVASGKLRSQASPWLRN